MAVLEAAQFLAQVHFLRDLSPEALEELAASLELETYEPGDTLVRQGTRVQALYFLLRGRVEVLEQRPGEPPQRILVLQPGDTLGEMELVLDLPWTRTIRALEEPVHVLRWDVDKVVAFLEEHPEALQHMRFAARSRYLARRLRFPWLAEDEVVYGLARKHWVVLAVGWVLPALLLAAAGALGWWAWRGGAPIVGWVGAGLALVGLAYGAWQWIDWRNDFYIVTDRRVVWLEKVVLIYDSRVEAPLHQVLSVSISTSVVGRALNYGDIIIRTYTGQVVFKDAADPAPLAAMVEEHWRRVQARRRLQDRAAKAQAVRSILEPPPPKPPKAPGKKPAEKKQGERRPDRVGLNRWTFELRFQEGSVITYRKHWAVLLRHIAAPSAAILLVAGLIGLRLAGQITLVSLSTFLLLAGALLLPLAGWWVYQYVDWANDIYQVTPTHLVDVYKKPLGREIRKVAPLENILGTEVDRRGIIGLLLNFGDVIANVGTAQFDFEGVFNPTGVQQDIVRAQEALLERKRQEEEKRRREEMVEWLSVYHEEASNRNQETAPRKDDLTFDEYS